MEFFGKANKAKEESLIKQYKEEINLIITDEIVERKTQKKEDGVKIDFGHESVEML